ncbi:HAD hydrolase-like protein [Cylindrospermopsis raciborskii]|uniref:Haloacid dehalogenase n=1 Tax=Cylindrospermopsis raciborskii CENA302 TaxID=1170768 RepID=A0A9Q5WBA4_9CYAN|nr:HAD hydrolase-like protein [Cylindrospermopsis raciborskii]MCZ2201913.1 HAD hydrolase-like protein [Cylindrospermopsis raciborskii PAMP2012]MCZ2206603.1 HAD hydrolase-like protein [Cylindrospermopsis raciborskii PAMP2011]NLQ05090.1 HAD family hydrolase [Cylindrospermopsis raciborskii MVCC19]OHY33462.1 haloacid dehalogenase [Cylindrospermopsis raciborskii MVCC14]OPH11337.1 haloacid dehalogenase [Cylindrospermopsis raciborskii CENA302]
MTVNHPTILALDFDGVICDGLLEYFEVAWRTYCQFCPSQEEIIPDDLALRFYRLRPVIETGWEMPILIKAIIDGFSDQQILQNWLKIVPEILKTSHLSSQEVGKKLDGLRDQWISTDLDGWLALHRFYPGVIERLKVTIDSEVELFIVTTKEGRFVKQLLEQEGVNLPEKAIFGKEVKLPKYEILRELIRTTEYQPARLWFVEDRLKTLQLVQQQSDLDKVGLFLADWGYNTQSEREAGQNDPRIQLLPLSRFVQDFSKWLSHHLLM